MKRRAQPRPTQRRRRETTNSRRRKQKQRPEPDDLDLPRVRGSLERTRALLLAALRVWELKNGFRLLAVPGGWIPIPL